MQFAWRKMQIAAQPAIGTTSQSLSGGFHANTGLNPQMPFPAGSGASAFRGVLLQYTEEAGSGESDGPDAGPQTADSRFEHLPSARALHAGADPKNEVQRRPPIRAAETAAPAPLGSEAAQAATQASSEPAATHNSQQAPQTAQAPEPENAGPPVSAASNLAFAMRIETNEANDGQRAQDAGETNSAVPESDPAPKGSHPPAVVEVTGNGSQQHETSTSNQEGRGMPGDEQPALSTRTSSPVEQQPASQAKTDFSDELNHANTAVRGAHVQVAGNGNQRVDIQLIERGGTLTVSVRSSDTALARDLQDHIPELAAGLQSEHYHSQTWTPSSGNLAGGRDGSGSASAQGYSPGAGGGQQQRRNGGKPRWVEELENHEGKSTNREISYVSSN